MGHTKGEWAWQKFGNTYFLTAQHGLREIIIGANPTNQEEGYVQCEATMNKDGILQGVDPEHPNAKLIASAPDMLECLLMFEKFDDVELYSKEWEELASNHLEMVEKAIKKATS